MHSNFNKKILNSISNSINGSIHKRAIFFSLISAILFFLLEIDRHGFLNFGTNTPVSLHAIGIILFAFLLGMNLLTSTILYIVVLGSLTIASHLKELTIKSPLTLLDIKLALGDLGGAFNAIGLASWFRYILYALIAAAISFAIANSIKKQKSAKHFFLTAIVYIFTSTLLIGIYLQSFNRLGQDLAKGIEFKKFSLDDLKYVRKSFGLLPYLAWYNEYTLSNTELYNQTVRENSDRPDLLRTSTSAFFKNPYDNKGKKPPNIIIILDESTFPPHKIFKGSLPIFDMFKSSSSGKVGRLITNTIGGGTWRSEYSVISGVDHRIFGFRGEYAPINLPWVSNITFPKFLRNYGYETVGLYPVTGDFYSAESAYLRYGFNQFFDYSGLDLDFDWKKNSDERVFNGILNKYMSLRSSEKPIMIMALTIFNHGPYSCSDQKRNLVTDELYPLEQRCILNDYLNRVFETDQAFKKFKAAIEKTGDSFIMINFGDHQSFTFTDASFIKYKYESKFSNRETFYRVDTSQDLHERIKGLPDMMNIASIPTFVSTMIAADSNSIYIPENFIVENLCGSDLLSCKDEYKNTYINMLKKKQFISR